MDGGACTQLREEQSRGQRRRPNDVGYSRGAGERGEVRGEDMGPALAGLDDTREVRLRCEGKRVDVENREST